MSIRVGGRKLDIPPVRVNGTKGTLKRPGSPLVHISNKAQAAIRQGSVSDRPRPSLLVTRTVPAVESIPDRNCLITGAGASAFMKGMAQEDFAYRETSLEAKQQGYQGAINFYQQIGIQHPKYREAALRRVFCTYKLAMMEADPAKKHELAQEVLTHFNGADKDSNDARFLNAACKQMLGMVTGDQTLLDESTDLFAQVDAVDSNPQHLALRHGEWNYTLSFIIEDLQTKRGFLQEAIECFSKIQDDRPTNPNVSFYPAASLRLGDCKLHLAFCAANGQEKQELLREAFNFYARVGLSEPNFTDVASKQGKCKFYEFLAESDVSKKQQLLTEAIAFFETVSKYRKYPKYIEACLDKGVCKQECANLEANKILKLKLYQEALELYALVRPDHPLFSAIVFRQGECKYQQASMATSPRIKQSLLQEALSFFTKVPDHHLRFKEASFYHEVCQAQLAALVPPPLWQATSIQERSVYP